MNCRKMITYVALTAMLSAVMGCQNQQAQNRKEAMGRWNKVRLRMAMDIAEEQLRTGQFAGALKTAQRALETDAEYAPALIVLGRAWLGKDKPGRAKNVFEACLGLDPGNAQASYYLGMIHERWDDQEQALTYYRRAQKLQSDEVDYAHATVEMLVRLGQTEEALEVLAEYARQHGPHERLLVLKGNILAANGDYDEAVATFEKAQRIGGADNAVTEALALALYQAGRPQKAVNLFEQLLDSDSDEPAWRYDAIRGECYMQLGEYHKAQRCLENASQHESDNAVVWTRLGQLALRRSQLERAKHCAERAASLGYDQGDLLMLQGCIALKRMEWDKSEAIFRQVIAKDSKDGLAYCLLGKSLQQNNETAEAMLCYREALRLDEDDELAQYLLNTVN